MGSIGKGVDNMGMVMQRLDNRVSLSVLTEQLVLLLQTKIIEFTIEYR